MNTQTKNKKMDAEHASFEYFDNIVHFTYKKGVYLDLAKADSLKQKYLEFIENDKELLIADGRNLIGISKEARDYLGGEMGIKGIKACALINDSFVTKTIINLFLKINQPAVPTKMFSDIDEATKWLKEVKV